jgi:hypothetical protein
MMEKKRYAMSSIPMMRMVRSAMILEPPAQKGVDDASTKEEGDQQEIDEVSHGTPLYAP